MSKDVKDDLSKKFDKLHAMSNYQFLMLEHLLKNGYSSKTEICKTIAHGNNNTDYKRYRNCPVFRVLIGKKLVVRFQENDEYYYNLAQNGKLTSIEKNDLIKCVQNSKKGYESK